MSHAENDDSGSPLSACLLSMDEYYHRVEERGNWGAMNRETIQDYKGYVYRKKVLRYGSNCNIWCLNKKKKVIIFNSSSENKCDDEDNWSQNHRTMGVPQKTKENIEILNQKTERKNRNHQYCKSSSSILDHIYSLFLTSLPLTSLFSLCVRV